MLALSLAVLAAAAPPAAAPAPAGAPATTVSPLTIRPEGKPAPVDAIVDMPADDRIRGEFVAVWPGKAYREGAEGRVILRCRINVHGLAEVCGVKSEIPEGKGFGAAAMQLRPTFKLPPAMGADGPVEAQMDIAVKFHPPIKDLDLEGLEKGENAWSRGDPKNNVVLDKRQFRGNPVAPHPVTMLSRPVWAMAPGFDDVAAAYPAAAGGVDGYVVAHCQVMPTGDLKNCVSVKETPDAKGFAKAALSLTPKFKVMPDLAVSPDRKPLWVDIPIRLPPPDQARDRTIATPHWLTDLNAAPNPFPAAAAAQGIKSGVGIADCIVGPAGALQCTPQAGTPAGLGFSEAVAQLASVQKVALWSDDAGPVLGGQIRLELRLDQ